MWNTAGKTKQIYKLSLVDRWWPCNICGKRQWGYVRRPVHVWSVSCVG